MKPHTRCLTDAIPSGSSLRRIALLTVLSCTVALLAAQFITHSRSRAQQLSLADRLAAQRALEQIYWQHRLWPQDNPQPKPSLDELLPAVALQAKVEDYLQKSAALERFWQRPVRAEELQAEMERMARDTKQPDVLRELFAALGHDPLLIAECLARPALVERLVREQYEADATVALTTAQTEARRAEFDAWWQQARTGLPLVTAAAGSVYRLPQIAVEADACLGDKWTTTSTVGAPSKRYGHTAVWTGNEMIIWGGITSPFAVVNTGGRYNPATDTWTTLTITGAPVPLTSPTAIWTGQEMIVWGDRSGGRYNPTTNTWAVISTTNAPSDRVGHTAVWTGSEMIVWGGRSSFSGYFNTGGRYNPLTDTWVVTSTTNAPSARTEPTAVWTGSEMIIWGGSGNGATSVNTGSRYNPVANSWTAVNLVGAPSSRSGHTAVWTGSEMIVWGGFGGGIINTGGRFNPATNAWAALSVTGAPAGKSGHATVWTGTEMIVWGGEPIGGRYNPSADTWILTATVNSPGRQTDHTAVWTGNTMLVWGGQDGSDAVDKGGVYSVSTYALVVSPTTKSFLGDGGTDSIAVTSPTGCAWTATSNANWLTITSGTSGTGNGMVGYSVAANNTGTPRTGTISVGNTTFTVTQAIINPVPTLTSTSPSSAVAAGPAFTLTVNGTNFVNGSIVRWGSSDRTTTFVSATQLTAAIPASDIALAGTPNVTVFNPPSGGGASNALPFTITGTPDLAMSKSHSGNFAEGSNGVYSLTVRNVGTAASTGTITVTDTLPNGLGYVSASGTGWTCAAAGQVVTCTRDDAIAPNGSSTISLTVSVGAAAIPSVTNTATVANASDSNAANNTASDPTTITCGYRLRPTRGQYFEAAGGSGTVQIESLSSCAWTATTSDSWITLTSANTGTGNGSVNFTVAANTGASSRRGTVNVSGTSFTVIQSGTSVICSITPLTGSGQVVRGTLDANDCTSLNQSLRFADRYSFSGVAGQQVDIRLESLEFFANLALFDQNGVLLGADNPAGPLERNSRLTLTLPAAGNYMIEAATTFSPGAYTLSLSSALPGCNFAVTPTDQSFDLAGGSGSLAVISTGGCEWKASTLARWITLTSNTNGNGNGTVNFTVAPNTGGKRTGTIFVGGQSFTVTQIGVPDSSYRGNWTGTTSQNRPVRFTVDGNDMVTNVQVDLFYELSSFPPISCVYLMRSNETVQVKDGRFSVQLSSAPVTILPGTEPVLQVYFDSTKTAEGNASDFRATVVFCSGTLSAGVRSIYGVTLTAQKQLVCPTVTGLSPASASPGQSVKITGTNLSSVAAVKFSGNATAQFTVNNDGTEITATVPAGAATGPITLSTPDCADVQTAAFTVIGCPTITLSPTTLPGGTVGAAYNQTVTASPSGTYSYAITAGALPAGLSLNAATGALTGTPTTAGSASVTITATGANNCTGSQAYTLVIAPPLPTLTNINPTSALVGSAGFTLTVAGTNFVSGAVVRWNGNDRTTTFVNDTQLTAAIPASDLVNAGSANVTVATTGGVSNALSFAITCSYAIAPTAQSFSNTGGPGTVTITTGNGCVWEATSDADWLTITSSRSGTGSGTLNYNVAANTGNERTASLTIAGQKLTITQSSPPASVNAASYAPNAPLAPDSIVSAFGQNLAHLDTGQSAPPGPLPTTLNGSTVKVKDSAGVERLAPLFYVGKTQVNYLVPTGTANGAATVTITNGAGAMATGTVEIVAVAPGIFSANADGKGLVVGSAIRVKNDIIIGEELLVRYDEVLQRIVAVPLEVGRPDERVIIQIYGTGLRQRSSMANVTVTIGGVAATVEYAGAQPQFVGLDQLNIEVPASLAGRGEVDLVVTVDGKVANILRLHIR